MHQTIEIEDYRAKKSPDIYLPPLTGKLEQQWLTDRVRFGVGGLI